MDSAVRQQHGENMTLFIDIEHPEQTETLRLMCGSDFEVLRTDNTGLEIYGKAHRGREYLLFPLDFRPLDAGVLSVRLPAEYAEWFLERGIDGARISFSTAHGSPMFAEMPEEYWSSAGFLRIDNPASIRVELDKVEPGSAAGAHGECGCGHSHAEHADLHGARPDARFGENPCACGHDHGPAGRQAADSGQDEPEETRGYSDRDMAEAIRAQTEALNELLRGAARMGLLVDLTLEREDGGAECGSCQRIHTAGIFRPL
jgi:hypothetical protein